MISIPLTIGAALLGLTCLYHATDGLQAFTAEGARRVAVAKHRPYVPDIMFEDMTGTSQSLRPQSGEIVLVEFIYTTCPTICQTAGSDFAQLRDALVQTRENVRMISVSFNPANDTLAALGDYAELHTASGSPWTVARVDVAQRAQTLDFLTSPSFPIEPPPLKWSAPIVRKAEDLRWPLRDQSPKRLS